MEEIHKNLEKAVSLMNASKWEQADAEFRKIIKEVEVKDDESAIIKGNAFIHAALCQLATDNFDKAYEDSTAAVTVYNLRRQDFEEQTKRTLQDLRSDPLSEMLSFALTRRAQVLQIKGHLLESLQQYSLAMVFKDNSEAKDFMQDLLEKTGMPEIPKEDDFEPFGIIMAGLFNPPDLAEAINKLLIFLNHTEFKPEIIDKYKKASIGRVLISVSQIYIESPNIVVTCFACLRRLFALGLTDVYDGILITRLILEHYPENPLVFEQIVKFAKDTPADYLPILISGEITRFIANGIVKKIAPEILEDSLFLLYILIVNDDIIQTVVETGIQDMLFEMHNETAFRVLSKISNSKVVAEKAVMLQNVNIIDWIFGYTTNEDINMVISAIHFAGSIIPYLPEEKIDEVSSRIFQVILPNIKQFSKDAAMISSAFSTLAVPQVISSNKEEIIKQKLVLTSSVLLSLHSNSSSTVLAILKFVYQCALDEQLKKEIIATKALIQTVVKALELNSENKPIIEYAIAIMAECEAPGKDDFLDAALKHFPESQILKKYATKSTQRH